MSVADQASIYCRRLVPNCSLVTDNSASTGLCRVVPHCGEPHPLEVGYDEYAVDIAEDRIPRSALHRMPGLPDVLRRRLVHLSGRLEGATVLAVGAVTPSWRGWIRLVGLVATALMTAFAIVHYNLRAVRKWAKRTGFQSDDLLLQRDGAIVGYEEVPMEDTPIGAMDPPAAA